MLNLRSSAHIRTNRHRRGYRCCPISTGLPTDCTQAALLLREWAALRRREARRLWLLKHWRLHVRRARPRRQQ